MMIQNSEQDFWRGVPGFEDAYEVSRNGMVRSLARSKFVEKRGFCVSVPARIMKTRKDEKGYYRVSLCSDGKVKTFLVHRLVALAFVPNPDNKPAIDHIDGNPSNNLASNLRWVTWRENNHNPITFQRYLNTRKRGEEHWLFGKPRSRETIEKVSRTKRLKGYSEEQKAQMVARLRAATKPHGGEHYRARRIAQYTIAGDFLKEWPCITDAAKSVNRCISAIAQCLSGKSSSCAGYVWKYLTN